MQGTRKMAMILLALLLTGGLAYAGAVVFGGWGGPKWADGYLYEADDLLLFAKLTKTADEKMEMEWTRLEKGLDGGVPVLNQMRAVYPAEVVENGELAIQGGNPGEMLSARVNPDELVLSKALRDVVPAGTRLSAADPEEFERRREAFAARIQREAEERKAEQAREKERVDQAKKAEKVRRLQNDLLENVQYLEKLDFSAELGAYEEQVVSLRSLLDEVKAYSGDPSLHRTEYEVMAATVESMKVLREGIEALADSMKRKKQNIENLASILETDMVDLTRTWEEIAAQVPDAGNRQQELSQVKEAASQAIARANERMAAGQGKEAEAIRQAEALYREAREILARTKEQHGW